MNPTDVVGTPREYEVWLAPDWSDFDPNRQRQRNWTRVSVRETLYANGRRVTEVLDENRQPIQNRMLSEDIDKEQEQRFQRNQDDAKPPGGLPTRTVNGQVFGWNPATRAYDIPTGQAPTGTAQTAAPGGKPFIDDGPDARENGRRWGWNDQTRLYDRDIGPSPTAQEIIRNSSLPPDQDPRAETDAERAARAKETIARQERDAQTARTEAARPGTKISSRTETRDGKQVTVETWRLPDGRLEDRIDSKPVDVRPGQVIKGGGPNGEDVQAVADPTTGLVSYQPIPGAKPPPTPPASADDFTPDITKPQMGLAEYRTKLAQLRASGAITEEQFTTRAQRAYETAVAEAKRIDTMVSAQQAAAQDLITQRGQDQQGSVSRLGQANQATQTALSESRQYASQMTPGGVAAAGGPILPAIMALQDARGQAWGGFHTPPQVTTGQFPAWDQMAGMGFGGPTPGAAPQPSAPTPPNALGLGTTSGMPAPGSGGQPAPLLPPRPPVPAGAVAPPAAPGTPTPAPVSGSPSTVTANPNAGAPPLPLLPAGSLPAAVPTTPQGGSMTSDPQTNFGAPTFDPATGPVPGAPPVGYGGQTLPAFAMMDPLLASMLGEDDDPDWQMAVMAAARNRGLA